MLELMYCYLICFFFKQKTAYEMRISDWSSDVCSSDLLGRSPDVRREPALPGVGTGADHLGVEDGSARGVHAPHVDELRGGLRPVGAHARSEERRVGTECVSPCRSRCSPYH